MALWEAWQRFNQPADFELPAWDEADVLDNVLPWTAASSAYASTEQHLRYKLFCISQELQRCEEELRFLPQDALNTLTYYQHQRQLLAVGIADQMGNVEQAACPAERAMCKGRMHVLQAWDAQVRSITGQAAQAFIAAGLIVAAN